MHNITFDCEIICGLKQTFVQVSGGYRHPAQESSDCGARLASGGKVHGEPCPRSDISGEGEDSVGECGLLAGHWQCHHPPTASPEPKTVRGHRDRGGRLPVGSSSGVSPGLIPGECHVKYSLRHCHSHWPADSMTLTLTGADQSTDGHHQHTLKYFSPLSKLEIMTKFNSYLSGAMARAGDLQWWRGQQQCPGAGYHLLFVPTSAWPELHHRSVQCQ